MQCAGIINTKGIVPGFRAWLFLILFSAAFQAVSAESFLYLFRQGVGNEFTTVEATQEEKISGILKLTTLEGKVVAWQEDMLAAKFALFDESKETPDIPSLETVLGQMKEFIAKEPGSEASLQALVDKWQAYLNRHRARIEDSTRKASEEKLAAYLELKYQGDEFYSLEILETKEKQTAELAALLPDQNGGIQEYWKPWAEELKNRRAGLERFEGAWQSLEAIAKTKSDRLQAARQKFLDEQLAFRIASEALPQSSIYLVLIFLGISALLFAGALFGGIRGIFYNPGLSAWALILLGLGGLIAYGAGTWLLLQAPVGYAEAGPVLEKARSGEDAKGVALDDLIFSIYQPLGSEAPGAPVQILIDEPAFNAFLKKYVAIDPSPKAEALSLIRQSMKVQVKSDRILIFDEMTLAKTKLLVCYTLYFSKDGNTFQFGRTEASIGSLPLPGRAFRHLWSQVEPVMGEVLTRSRVLDNYYIKRMELGEVEMVSIRNARQQAAH